MPRQFKHRKVDFMPRCEHFKPVGIPAYDLEEIALKVEEVEAIRLKDLLQLDQESCASRMDVSRQTFQRVLNAARKKIAEALIEGKALRIEGGIYSLNELRRCPRCDYSLVQADEKECPKCGFLLEGSGRKSEDCPGS